MTYPHAIEFSWTGNLDDDCTARHGDFVLRAEKMGRRSWWWCVYEGAGPSCITIANSNNLPRRFRTGEKARRGAEDAVRHAVAAADERAFREKGERR